MAKMTLTPAICNAAGMDAGNRSMRAAGRKAWNREDYNAAAAESGRLWDLMQPEFVAIRQRLEAAHA